MNQDSDNKLIPYPCSWTKAPLVLFLWCRDVLGKVIESKKVWKIGKNENPFLKLVSLKKIAFNDTCKVHGVSLLKMNVRTTQNCSLWFCYCKHDYMAIGWRGWYLASIFATITLFCRFDLQHVIFRVKFVDGFETHIWCVSQSPYGQQMSVLMAQPRYSFVSDIFDTAV